MRSAVVAAAAAVALAVAIGASPGSVQLVRAACPVEGIGGGPGCPPSTWTVSESSPDDGMPLATVVTVAGTFLVSLGYLLRMRPRAEAGATRRH
jgi:hypothetical protein